MTSELTWLQSGYDFPPPERALADPNGLLAAGGDLSPDSLVKAYRNGIFPWYSEGQPPLWWSPDPRAVLLPGQVHTSKSLHKEIRRGNYRLSTDSAFPSVINACATGREEGTWILPEMIEAYEKLFQLGYAHSVELWLEGDLVGGLYGIAVGNIFCGESMFSRHSNASKITFVCLATLLFNKGFQVIDCQVENPHLSSLGVTTFPRSRFLTLLEKGRDELLDWPKIDHAPSDILNT